MLIRDVRSCSLDVGAPRHSRVLTSAHRGRRVFGRVPQTALAVRNTSTFYRYCSHTRVPSRK
eukprot:693800-Prymnesium_polylepis.1